MMLGFEVYFLAIGIANPSTIRFVTVFTGFMLFYKYIFNKKVINSPFVIWSILYFLYVSTWYFVGGAKAYASGHFLGSIYLLVYAPLFVAAYSHIEYQRRIYSWLLMICLGLGVYSVFIDDGSIYGINKYDVSRGSGYYLNPNTAAIVFAWSFIFILYRKSLKFAIAALLLTSIGILLTLSRGGMIILACGIVGAFVRGYLPRFVLVCLIIIFSLPIIVGPTLFDFVLGFFSGIQADSLERIQFIFGQNIGAGIKNDDRFALAMLALDEFIQHPLLGNGLGYTAIWNSENNQGTHNTLLMHIVEFGITGLWILPGFCIAMWKSAKSKQWQDRTLLILMILLMSVFSHNLFDSMTSVFLMTFMFLAPSITSGSNKIEKSE